ncbi:protein mono-ADP-ribosyltransferase PARP14-like isoform X2 [Dreissena polymorpha]|uniref:protein mono-ADP-ribosyltransferase PARP14-like isoform X2 n=1 Tax=Dreissena polymorpha TaxID=45954 RepID=UPI002263B74E|nr:protein mono-ADP-ribosyltransferase PARP14-like isoform X2 [Dreissena polymorpha]
MKKHLKCTSIVKINQEVATLLKSNLDQMIMLFFITFEGEDVAKRVLKRGNHRIMRQDVNVELLIPSRSTKASKATTNNNNKHHINKSQNANFYEDVESKPLKTVKVRGVKLVASRDSVQLYFENKNKAGGGEIEKISTDEHNDDVIYIEYKDESVAKAVVERKHAVDGHLLEVTLHTPSVPLPSYSDRLLIKGLNSQITFNVLDLYMEARMGLTLVEGTMIYHVDQEDTALVTVRGAIDMAQVDEACKSKPLEGSILKISTVPISNCVLVSNISDTVTADTVALYFENKNRSNGGPVEKVDLFTNQSYCLVYFVDYMVVDSVLSKEQTLDGRRLEVKRYFQCIGRAEGDTVERIFKRPNSVTVRGISQKIYFLHHSVAKKEALEKELIMCHAKVNWPSSDNIGDVEICCLLSEDVKDCVNLAKTWATTVKERFEQAINTIEVARIFVVQDILGKVNDKLGLLKPNAEINIQIHENNICLVGEKDALPNIKKDLERLVQETQEASEKEKTWLKIHISNLKPIETQMLTADEFTSRMAHKYTDCTVKIDQNTNTIEIEGVNDLVNKIQIEMYQTKDTFQKTDINIPREAVEIYMSSIVKDFIDNKFKRKKVVAVWEATNETLLVISRNEEMLRETVDIVRNAVKIGKVYLEPESRSLLQLKPWEHIVTTLNKEHGGKLSIKVTGDAIIIICTDDIHNSVFGTINAFLDKNTKYTDKLSFPRDIHELLLRHHLQDMLHIAKGQHVEFREQSNGFELIGTKMEMQSIRKELESFAKRVKRKKHLVSKPGISEFMDSEKGRFILKSVGRTHPVVVRTSDDDSEDDNTIYGTGLFGLINPPAESVLASCTGSGNRKIHVFIGDMTDLNVDVFVNTANEKLSLLSGLGKALVQKGGDAITRECNQYIETNKKMGESALFASTAGNLKAKRIFHISGPRWKDGHQGEDDKLAEVVFKALHQASGMGYKSLAMPAISCGGYGYPVKRATSVIITSVKNFFREVQDSELREIYLCDMKEETVNGFVEGLEREWGASNVQRFERKKSTSVITSPRTSVGRMEAGKNNQDPVFAHERGPPPLKRNPWIGTPLQPIKLGNISVTVHKAEIAMHDIPVIVNTTSRNLDLNNGTVSKTILRQAGHEIQDDLKQMFPTGISEGQVAITKGYKLKCSNVIHGAVSNWDGQKTIDALKSFLKICFEETQKLNHSGIAFPAIGTGNLGYPKDVVATEMFTAVSEFAAKYPQSSITNVDFILYPKDGETIRAFEQEITNWSKGSRKGQGRARCYDHIENLAKDGAEEHIYDELPDSIPGNSNEIVIGNVTISVRQGDITQENADCIVNSSNEDLDLERGNVSKALAKICGNELLKQAKSMQGEMKRGGLAITKAPGLQCRNIMHVVARDSAPGWKEVIGKCLKKAKAERYRSIAFPALGTGIRVVAAEAAHVMFQAVTEFVTGGCGSLTDVRFVIYQPEMVDTFTEAARHAKGLGLDVVGGSQVQQLSDKTSSVNLIFYALEDSSIRNAIEQLESLIDGEVHTESFENPVIKRLDDRQNQAIKRAAEKFNVDLKVTDKGVEIVGIMTNVHNASTCINRILNDALQIESDKKSALLLQDVVQWYYIEVTEEGDELKPYDQYLNFLIEKAYKNQDDSAQYRENSLEIVVDFKNLQEYEKGETDENKKTKIVRKDVYKDILTETPKEWKDMKGNLLVHTLLNVDPKYAEIEKAFMASAGSGLTVQKIEMVQNKSLWHQYAAKKKQLEGQNPPGTVNERFLWHGTSEDTVDSVNAHGFNRSYCGKNATKFGDGVYFAVNADYSVQDTYSRPDQIGVKRMYYCGVLTGEYTVGQRGMRVLPSKPSGNPHDVYDSATNDLQKPIMFIIFNDTHAYPFYIINFKRA